MRILFEKR